MLLRLSIVGECPTAVAVAAGGQEANSGHSALPLVQYHELRSYYLPSGLVNIVCILLFGQLLTITGNLLPLFGAMSSAGILLPSGLVNIVLGIL